MDSFNDMKKAPLQVLREWPPGYGGVERVAHEMANVWGGSVYSFDSQRRSECEKDPLHVNYVRHVLPCICLTTRLRVPLPSKSLWSLLRSTQPLHGHLPSPGVLLILMLAIMLRPKRQVTAHWHCFLHTSPDWNGRLFGVYQWLALRCIPFLSSVVTTSPLLADDLVQCGLKSNRILVLPCCLSADQEREALALPFLSGSSKLSLRILFIGRLDSYKRLDWLLQAVSLLQGSWQLDVVGDGPNRSSFEALSQSLFAQSQQVFFHGRLSESAKLALLAEVDVLVLPSDRCNEAFGIVQLEAMAAGVPALAFQCPRSGMAWVGQLPSLLWTQSLQGLPAILQRLLQSPSLRAQLAVEARQRYLALFARTIWLREFARMN